jgi:lysophospholipase L1-like esterase
MSPQPLIVPLVMANFDKLASQYTYKCEIKPPFKMRDLGITDKNDAALPEVVAKLNHQYKHWVSDLLTEEMDFESEISKLEKQIKNIKTTDDLVVFYGSSTIRLWNSLQDDFPHTNTLNLGFGGAFISSLSQNFERLFTFEAPKAIVLYLGGNDLSLGWTAEKIIKKIKTLIAIIHSKFPGTSIINLSIKPSIERSNQIEKIIQINKAIILFAEKTDFLIHVNIFDDLLKDGKANPNYFLRDGLHLNGDGYKILKKQIKNYL